MKSIIIILFAAIVCGNSALAQQSEVPYAVKAAFSKKCSTAKKVKWDKEGNKYEASFLQNEKHMSVLYNANGVVEETETKISVAELPARARSYAKSKGAIKEAAMIVAANGTLTYEAEVRRRDLIFDDMGYFLEERIEKD